ncbi:MAG: alpha/beta fold hydrolase [Candidatus Sulfotelmatobacter sp.]
MKRALNLLVRLAVVVSLFLFTTSSSQAYGQMTDKTIAQRTAEIDGAKLHYMTAGQGTPLILLHGYAETSLMWKPIIPILAERFTVIAPDLPGIGDSDIPAKGLDMKSAALASMTWPNRWECRKLRLWDTISGLWLPMPTPRSSRRR